MPSVKERIAALQKSQQNESSSVVPQSQNPVGTSRKSVNKNFQYIQSRIAIAQSTLPIATMTKDQGQDSQQAKPSRSNVSSISQKLKGMDVQAMLSGHKIKVKTPSTERNVNNTETEEGFPNNTERMNMTLYKRAMIGHGRRRPRSIPTSLQGIKFSTE